MPQATVSVEQICELAGVGPSAVTNWRNRHKDFPKPLRGAGELRFDAKAILDWLKKTGRATVAKRPTRKHK